MADGGHHEWHGDKFPYQSNNFPSRRLTPRGFLRIGKAFRATVGKPNDNFSESLRIAERELKKPKN